MKTPMTRRPHRPGRAALAALILACSLLATGCWDAEEINHLAIIGALGMDLDLEGRPILGVEIVNPADLAAAVMGDAAAGQQIVAWMLLEPLTSYAQVMAEISRRVPRVPYLGHVPMIIFGRTVAEQGVGPYLDFLARTDIIRRSVLVSVCDTAVGLLQRPLVESLPSLTLDGLAGLAVNHSYSRITTLNDFLRRLAEPGIEPIAMHTVGRPTYDLYVAREGTRSVQAIGQPGVIPRPQTGDPRAEKPPRLDPQENIQGHALPQPEQTFLAGIAAFRGQQAVGYLDGIEGRGFLWATGSVRRTVIAVPHPGNPSGQVLLACVGASARTRARMGPDRPEVTVEMRATFRVEESTHPLDLLDHQVLRSLQQAAARVMVEEASHSLARVQGEFRSDIYGFGVEVHRRYPRYWRQVADRWNDVFSELPVSFQARAHIHAGGLLHRATAPR